MIAAGGGRGRVDGARVVLVRRVGTAIALGLVLGATSALAAEPKPAEAKPGEAKPGEAKPAKTKAAKTKTAAASDAGKRALPAARLDVVARCLAGEDDAAAVAAAAALGASGAANAAEPLAELLAAGAAPARTEAALDALGKLGGAGALTAPRVFEVLDLYAGHRAPEIRQRAVKALGTVKDPRATTTLLARLGDAAPGVRASAGDALAARRDRVATVRLFALVKKSDAGAASPLAALATPDLIPQIAELAGSVDDGVLATTLGEYAQRGDVPDRLRLDVVRTIAKLPGRRGDDRAGRIHRVGAREGRSPVEARGAEAARRAGDGSMSARARATRAWRSPSRAAALSACATSPYKRAGNAGEVASALARSQPRAPAARSLAFLVLGRRGGPARGGLRSRGLAPGLDAARCQVTTRIAVGGDVIIHGSNAPVAAAAGGPAPVVVVARDIGNGAVLWQTRARQRRAAGRLRHRRERGLPGRPEGRRDAARAPPAASSRWTRGRRRCAGGTSCRPDAWRVPPCAAAWSPSRSIRNT